MTALAAIGGLCLFVALGGGRAQAAPRMSARPVFTALAEQDRGCAIVILENDEKERRVLLRAGIDREKSVLPPNLTEMEIDLPSGARKRVFLPIPPGARPASLELVDDGEIIAVGSVGHAWLSPTTPAVAALAPLPRSLVTSAVGPLQVKLAEVALDDVPANLQCWPELRAWTWEFPPGADAPPGVSDALRRHVVSGGWLLLGINPEDPSAPERNGLGDLLPARPERGEGLEVALTHQEPRALALGVEGALAWQVGLGRVVLVPGPLEDIATPSWPMLLGIDPALHPTMEQWRQNQWRMQATTRPPIPEAVIAPHVPKPPWWGAGLILGAFFLAAVPVDGWLTRRSLRQGRRSRLGALRYPSFGVLATFLAWMTAEFHSGEDLRTWRLDIVDVAPDGRGIGQSHVLVTRGAAGALDAHAVAGSLDGLSLAMDSWHQPPRFTMLASADPALPASRLRIDSSPWESIIVSASWMIDTMPSVIFTADSCATSGLPPSPAAWQATCGARSDEFGTASDGAFTPSPENEALNLALLPEHEDWPLWPVLVRASGQARMLANPDPQAVLPIRRSAPALILGRPGRIGPEISVDGVSTDERGTTTLLRYHRESPLPRISMQATTP